MKKFLAIAVCALFAGCLEPQKMSIELPKTESAPKAQSIFDKDLGWVPVKSVRIYTMDPKKTEVERITESAKHEIDRALREDVPHWITDSVFVYESTDQLFIKEFRRDEPRLYEYPRNKFIFEFIQK